MTQTAKNRDTSPLKQGGRPGQRQQERLQRIARRRRRRLVVTTTISVVALLIVASLGFWQYQRYTSDQANAASQRASATAKARDVRATATAKQQDDQASATAVANAPFATATVDALSASLTPAPATPPAVSGTPTKTSDGLEYLDLKEGTGPAAKQGSDVTVFYTGWIQSTGAKFDSSYDDGKTPFDVTPLGSAQVIPGWNEGLIGMKAGGERRLIIPPALAYGAQGQGPIPANATLIFDVTAVAVK